MDRPRRAAAAAVNYCQENIEGAQEEAPQRRSSRARVRVVESESEEELQRAAPRHKPARASGDSLMSIGAPKASGASALGRFGFSAADKSSAIDAMMASSQRQGRAAGTKSASKKTSRRAAPVKIRERRNSSRTVGQRLSYAEPGSDDSGSGSVSESSSAGSRSSAAVTVGSRSSTRSRQAPNRLDASVLLKRVAKKTTRSAGSRRSARRAPSESEQSSEPESSESESSAESHRRTSRKRAESDEEPSDGIEYRIQQILGSQQYTPAEWRVVIADMNTHELTRGSVWEAPDSEYFSNSPVPVEKFLIKWQHASYLHVSWELEKDLLDIVGTAAKTALNKYRERAYYGQDLFEDIGSKEHFPPSFLVVDRVLDVDSEGTVIQEIDWETALLPSLAGSSPTAEGAMEVQREADGSTPDSPLLHGLENCFITVKWEGLSYRECSFENVQDLIRRGIDYESPLRAFYRREQSEPTARPRCVPARTTINRTLATELHADQDKPPKLSGGDLRDYQWESVRWMSYNWSQRRNSILADEMGLGKTIQASAFLQCLKTYQNVRGPFLVIAPLSTLINWVRELSSWTDLDVVLYHGSQEDRELIREYEFHYLSKPRSEGYKIQVVVTSFEMAVHRDHTKGTRELSQVFWEMLVIDEAHKIKNYSSKLNVTLREEYKFRNSLLLTGTPLQNNTDELWSLLNFVDTAEFSDLEKFKGKYGELRESEQLQALQKQLRPYLLRRIKENVEKSVPPKEELIIEVELTVAQKQYYRAIFEQNRSFLFRGGNKNGPGLSNLAMELRKCCNHPFLVKGAEQALLEHFHKDRPIDVMVDSSGKLVLLDKLLPKLLAGGHKVLIFSQFRIMLDILEDYLLLRGYYYSRIDGAITGRRRQEAIDRFSAPGGNQFVMLLSTRAGGVGINLTTADTVIIFDSDWNPQNDIQAQARAHRIGQKKNVKVYRLLTRKTYEMHLFNVASMKLGLDYALMHNLRSQYGTQPSTNKRSLGEDGDAGIKATDNLSKKEIENLLKHGAYDMFREEKDGQGEEASKRFCEEDIDSILQRSTLIVHKSGGQADVPDAGVGGDNPGGALNSFAKASFVSSKGGEENDVAIDDPLFWEKVVGVSNNDGGNSSSEEYEDEDGKVQRRKVVRKRRCTRVVGSYNEAGMNFQELSKAKDDDYAGSGGDSSGESVNSEPEKGGRRARTSGAGKKTVSLVLPRSVAEGSNKTNESTDPVNKEAVETIAGYLGVYGYGSWDVIGHALNNAYSTFQIARVCRNIVLHTFKLASVSTVTVEKVSETGDPIKESVTSFSNAKVQSKCLGSPLYLLLHLTDCLSEYLVRSKLRDAADTPDEITLLQWVVDRIARVRGGENVNVSTEKTFFDMSPPPLLYLSPEQFILHLVATLKEYCGNISSDPAGVTPAEPFQPELTTTAVTEKLADLQIFEGADSVKLKSHTLDTLFDLFLSVKLNEVAAVVSVAAETPSVDPVPSRVEATLMQRAEPFAAFVSSEKPVLPGDIPAVPGWTDRHDALLLTTLFEFGWSPQSYRRLILPAFEAVGLFVEGGFYCDKKEMRQLMATLLRRAKEILCIMRQPARKEMKPSVATAMRALQHFGVPFSGVFDRCSFLPPADAEPKEESGAPLVASGNCAEEEMLVDSNPPAVEASSDTPAEGALNDVTSSRGRWEPYPACSFIPPENKQINYLSSPYSGAACGLPPIQLFSWESIAARCKGTAVVGELAKIARYILANEKEIDTFITTDTPVYNGILGPVKPRAVRDALQGIETMWKVHSLLLLRKPCALPPIDWAAAVSSELCPEHKELADVLSQRLKKLNQWWSGTHDVRLLRLVLCLGLELPTLNRTRRCLVREEEGSPEKAAEIPSVHVLVNRVVAITRLVGTPFHQRLREAPRLSNAFQKLPGSEQATTQWLIGNGVSRTSPVVVPGETELKTVKTPLTPLCNAENVMFPSTSPCETNKAKQVPKPVPTTVPLDTPVVVPAAKSSDMVAPAPARAAVGSTLSKKKDVAKASHSNGSGKKPQQMSLMMSFNKSKLKQEVKKSIRTDVAAAIHLAASTSGLKQSGLKDRDLNETTEKKTVTAVE